jgi:glutamate synthase domain-containing protein 2/rubredoxin
MPGLHKEHVRLTIFLCDVCKVFEYDDELGYSPENISPGTRPFEFPDYWQCPICKSDKTHLNPRTKPEHRTLKGTMVCPHCGKESHLAIDMGDIDFDKYLGEWERRKDDIEIHMDDIHRMSATGQSIIEPMRTTQDVISWDQILIMGAQLATLPLNEDEDVNTRTVIGPMAERPMMIDMPIYVTHMSFGALSRDVKMALAKGSAAARTAMCSGEGGVLPEVMERSYRYIFEYVPNRYSVNEDTFKKVDAVEIKIGQSAKPGMGGHLPSAKVTEEIASIRGFPKGMDIISPARFDDISNEKQLKEKVEWLREMTGGKPIGIKMAAGNIEKDLGVATFAKPDFITIDGRPGATAAASKFVKMATSVPTIFALARARSYLNRRDLNDISLVITGGLRISSDFAKALAMGADAVAIGTSALMACACQQYRLCDTGKCPVGVTTQDLELRERLNVDYSANKLENFLSVSNKEIEAFARLTGKNDVHSLDVKDLCTFNSEISNYTKIGHV